MINTEWRSHKRRIKEALQFGLLMPLYIVIWTICIVAAVILEAAWKIGKGGANE